MDVEPRPNIITVGALAGGVAQLIAWLWNGLALGPPLGTNEGMALATVLTAAAQWCDRHAKRGSGYVVTKYADQQPGEPP